MPATAVRDPNGRAYNRTAFLPDRRKMMQARAGDLLGLDQEQADDLFYPVFYTDYGFGTGYEAVTPEEPPVTLDKLVETGEVDWSHIPQDRAGA